MTESIRLLDCTLRDGGHVVDGNFGEKVMTSMVKRLVDAGIDIIEVGFLWREKTSPDMARFYTIEDAKRILPKEKGNSHFSLMADFIDLEHLEPCDGTIEFIRLSFKRHRLDWALSTAKILMDKGYKCFINPVNCNVYSDGQYLDVLKKVNELHPYGFSIVDTFGVLRKRDLTRMYNLVENTLDKDITIGLHLHENLGLAYSLAQHFLEIHQPTRKIVIDGSLLGMGRIPGNLCIEQIMDHMNCEYGREYQTEPAFDAIDDYIAPIKNRIPWGYSIPYALSAKYHLHRTYAEYLMNKKRLSTKDIQRILSQVEESESELFNEEYIEKLYRNYLDVKIDSSVAMKRIQMMLKESKTLLLVAPGASVSLYKEAIAQKARDEDAIIIGINFVPDFLKTNYVFCTNNKRYQMLVEMYSEQYIRTSNINSANENEDYIISFNDLVYHHEEYCDDSTLMFLNLLEKIDYSGKIFIAGFDGFDKEHSNYCSGVYEQTHINHSSNEKIDNILERCYANQNIKTLTPTMHKNLEWV